MKRTSEAILNLLKGEVVENKFNELIISNPNFTHGDVTVSESLEKYLLLKSDMQQFVSIDIWEQQP
ncbi:MAG: hypothetical protein KA143_05335, partial [Saprospiraceae bacterium]|nr:hypothetical protein [Saprospiraceae bacterium]